MTNVWLVFGMVAATWGVRVAPFVFSRLRLPPALLNILNCVPAAVLAALVAQPVLAPAMAQESIWVPEVIAAGICLVLGYFKVPMLLVVIFGMASYWLLGLWL